MTAVDEIRNAAALMRERAKKATPGPWFSEAMGSEGSLIHNGATTIHTRRRPARCSEYTDGDHVASWHPQVALATAELLEHIADDMGDQYAEERTHSRADGGTYTAVHPTDIGPRMLSRWDWTAALAVARAYLGRAEQ